MVSSNLLTTIVRDTFLEKVGKFKSDKYGKMTFATPTKEGESGYRHLEVVIYAPSNYVQVWTRETWTVISEDDLEYDEANDDTFIKPGKDYTTGSSPWKNVADHDSGWTSGLNGIFQEWKTNLLTFSGPGPWFQVMDGEFQPSV